MPAYAHPPWSAPFWTIYLVWVVQEVLIFRRDRRPVEGRSEDRGSLATLVAATVVALVLAFTLARFHPTAMRIAPGLIEPPALALMVGGMALRIWAVRTLGAFFRVAVTAHDDHRLIDTGPYRRLRHPAYTGGLLTVAGVALAMGNWLSLLAIPVAALGFARRIAVEEGSLARRFAAAWPGYRARRWALVPPIW